MNTPRNYEVQKLNGLVEKALSEGKESSESAIIQISQVEYISGETLADLVKGIKKYKGMYEEELEKNKKYSKIMKIISEK